MCVQSLNLNNAEDLSGPTRIYYNATYNFRDLDVVDPTNPAGSSAVWYQNQHGVLVSSTNGNGDNGVQVFGVKSDRGTADGYMTLPLTETSTEFVIAVWKYAVL